jgi:hypothetical protein
VTTKANIMKYLFHFFRPVSLLIGFTLVETAVCAVPALKLEAPVTLPRDAHLGAYSPALRIEYSGVPRGRYRLKLWLLESSTDNYYCASTQWCEREFRVENTSGTNTDGAILICENFDVFDYAGFLWVARFYDQDSTEVTSARLEAASAAQHPPTLHRIGRKSCVVGEELRFKVNATGTGGQGVKFLARALPPGAELDATTGEFKWKPTLPGKFPSVIIEASIPATGLTDAEVIEIEVKATK